ncbi:MAG: hypothetical protein V7693_00070 [Halopseudomonas sabulinigri]|tara:strand:+ start:9389 stop:9646 length:258 start_codon:yes stop_codon:yes gene_type:complete
MNQPQSDVYRYIVRELAPTDHTPEQAPITIVCEPQNVPGQDPPNGTVFLHMLPGTTTEEAQSIADTLQAKVKGLCHLQTPADATA